MADDDILHEYWTGKPGEDALTPAHLQIAVAMKMTDTYGPFWESRQMPEGLRLEIHPGLWNRMCADRGFLSYAEFGTDYEKVLSKKFGVPVIVNARLARDHFRLVVVTEEILLGGSL